MAKKVARLKSGKKAHRQSLVREQRNTSIKREVKERVKEFQKLVAAGKKSEALAKLPLTFSVIDKAAKRHVFHKNKAANKKSQLAKMVA